MLRHLRNQNVSKRKTDTKSRDKTGRTYDKKTKFGLETIEPDDELPQGYLSNSQVTMYLRCARQYEFRYIKKIIAPPGVALTEGSCHHTALEYDNNSKFKTGEPLSTMEVLDVFADRFRDKSRDISKSEWNSSGETLDTVIGRGRIFVSTYMENFSRLLIPSEEPEKRIEMELGGVPFLGFIDIVTKKAVTDYKVVSRSKSQKDTDDDLQLTIYSLAEKKKKVEFCCFCKTKVPKIVRLEALRTEKDYIVAEEIIEGVADSIKKGAFPMCNPADNFLCTPRFCGYHHKCVGQY